jgi:hypothetical protein
LPGGADVVSGTNLCVKETAMSTTQYYEGDLPLADAKTTSEAGQSTRKIEILVSDFFGTHELYLRIDEDTQERTMRLDKAEARALLEGLGAAMRYMNY